MIMAGEGPRSIPQANTLARREASNNTAHRQSRGAGPGSGCPDRAGRRRPTGQPVSELLKKTQGQRLGLIATRNRAMAADDARNLLLERLGLIARTGDAWPHHLRGYLVVEWTITDAGLTALSEVEITGSAIERAFLPEAGFGSTRTDSSLSNFSC